MKTKTKKLAFTLAEVLITLSIIGIVAQMTIPTMMADYQKTVETTQLKKFYSAFGQGMKNYIISQGCMDLKCTGAFNGSSSSSDWDSNIEKMVKTSFKIAKHCPKDTEGCQKKIKLLNKNTLPNNEFQTQSFITVDNFLFTIWDLGSGYESCSWIPTTTTSKLKNACGRVRVDINGNKKPDMVGRDIFHFYIGNDGMIYPDSGSDYAKIMHNMEDYENTINYWRRNTDRCGTAGSSELPETVGGWGCAARIMEEGWEMNY